MNEEWIKVTPETMPEYYTLIWCVNEKIGKVHLGMLVGRSYNPPEKIWRDMERTHWIELDGITHYQICKRPEFKI